MNFTSEMVLEGIAKAGSKGKCTAMGRAAMSLDLQAPFLPHRLQRQKAFETLQAVILKSMKLRMHIKEGTHCLLSSLLFGTRYQHVRQLAKKG